ncbi:sensor histidine kinase [Pseudonocardia lacus]|uniref:sensor histidine kinase n=1 Tax=Pseudonocardia lacus TaxID=2835865 RepID=UPI001BDC01D9|nr:ATP-binding protein [Pseudonocardia lacus]
MVPTTLRRLAGLTVLAAVLLCGLVALGVRLIGEAEGERTAHRVSTQVAAAVLVRLAEYDFTGFGPADRAELATDLAPFVDSGMVFRIKVWSVEGDRVRIVFSDEQRIESQLRPFDPQLGARLDAGETVVLPVPDDAEHRFESDRADDLREVYIGFRDAAGAPARFEIYVPVDVTSTVRHAMGVLLPLALAGVLLLGCAMLPLAVVVARRIDRDRRERQDALHYGLAAAELARRDLARKLHDDVIPDLAGAGLLLDTAATSTPSRAGELVATVRARIHDSARQLRALLSDLAPPAIEPATVPQAFARLIAGLAGDGPRSTLDVADDLRLGPDAAVLLHRATGELLRNALIHSGATAIRVAIAPEDGDRVRVTVTDDGRGFDPTTPSRPGHIGLLLVRRAVEDAGGTMTVHSGPGTSVDLVVPADLRLRPVDVPAGRGVRAR